MTVVSTALFSDRAKHYASYRPSYSDLAINVIRERVGIPAAAADIGAGTGIFCRQLLEAGYDVHAVEPNRAMRDEAVALCRGHRGFHVAEGTGENTGLPEAAVDLITVAQAFHWLDRAGASKEFQRIGKRGCITAVIWNTRKFESTPFMQAYKRILDDMCPAYKDLSTHWSNLEDNVVSFLDQDGCRRDCFPNTQMIDLETLIGNLASTSYAPKIDEPGYEELIGATTMLFEKSSVDGRIAFVLDTILFTGKVRS